MRLVGAFFLPLLFGCAREDTAATLFPTEASPLIRCTFVEFKEEKVQGRFAILEIENLTAHRIVNVRGRVQAFGPEGSEVYSFPWGAGALPQLVKGRDKLRVSWGFEIPPSAVSATFVPEELDVIMPTRKTTLR